MPPTAFFKSSINSLNSALPLYLSQTFSTLQTGRMQETQELSPRGRIEDNGLDDFSFVCLNPDGSPISAEDAFVNGQIRPVFPMFDQRISTDNAVEVTKDTPSVRPQLKNLFTEELICSKEDGSRVSPEIYYEWSPPPPSSSTPKLGKKSHSTGFSKLWRFGEKIRRSSSDGKEAFVFLRSDSSGSGGEKAEKNRKEGKRTKGETAAYYHERLYARNKAENEMNKRKSYLPYRSNLMGFFSTPNGLSRNF